MKNRRAKYLDLFNDVTFKKVFKNEQNKDLLIYFLNSVYKGKRVIKDIIFRDGELLSSMQADGRACYLDIFCESEAGDNYLIEVQLESQVNFRRRMGYYMYCLGAESVRRGDQNFENIKGVHAICITNFKFGNDQFRLDYGFNNIEDPTDCLEDFSLTVLQISKLPHTFEECKTEIEQLVYVMANLDKVSEKILALNKEFARLGNIMTTTVLTEEETYSYLRTRNALWAQADALQTAVNNGLE